MYYFLTFRTYGTWLHGDERGSVDRLHNQRGEPLLGADERLQNYRRGLLKTPAVILDEPRRACVERTLREVAHHRGWTLHALAVLSNHVHLVVQTTEERHNANPERICTLFKSYTTRRLREAALIKEATTLWAHHASTRYLHSEESLIKACHYVQCQHTPPTAHDPCEPGT